MRERLALVGVTVMAASLGWWGRGIEFQPADLPPAPVVSVAQLRAEAALPWVARAVAASPRESRAARNLFAYREAPAPVMRVVAAPIAVYEPPPAIVTLPPATSASPRRQFSAKYIGRFGPEANPLAAFVRDGEIVNLRAGGRIDEHFVLRRIGIESVDVESMHEGAVVTERIALQ